MRYIYLYGPLVVQRFIITIFFLFNFLNMMIFYYDDCFDILLLGILVDVYE